MQQCQNGYNPTILPPSSNNCLKLMMKERKRKINLVFPIEGQSPIKDYVKTTL